MLVPKFFQDDMKGSSPEFAEANAEVSLAPVFSFVLLFFLARVSFPGVSCCKGFLQGGEGFGVSLAALRA